MTNIIKPSIKKYIITLVIYATIGMVIGTIIITLIGGLIGFGSQGVLVMVLIAFPVIQFSTLYGFYKGLKKHYNFQG
jgi:hypothetical protein